ncbi:MAG: YciI family protein [Phenylobacterium sp.]
MRYLTIYRPSGGVEGGMPEPAHMAAMGQLIEEMTANGTLISTEPLTARDHCARITLADGRFTVADEPVRAGGFAILNFASKEAAIEGCKQFLQVAGDGVVEMRQVLEFAPQPA